MDTAQIGQIFGIGDGTVSLYTRRVCTALMRSWRDAVRWPTEEEQMKMKLRLQARPSWQVFEDCISMLNGTLIPSLGSQVFQWTLQQTISITGSSIMIYK